MNRQSLLKFAQFGAEARLNAIRTEVAAILKQFPGLRKTSRPTFASLHPTTTATIGRAKSSASAGDLVTVDTTPTRGRRPMSVSERTAVSRRMKRYWAARRKAKGIKP